MDKLSVLIVDDIHVVFLEKLREAGIQVDYLPALDRAGALRVIGAYDGLVIRSKFQVDKSFLEAATRLRFIARAGAGLDNIDDFEAAKRGLTLLNAPEGNRQAVAEHMTGMLLSLLNHLHTAHVEIQNHRWLREENRGHQLQGQTVGLIGYGHNGQAMARCLSGFGVEVLAYDKYHHDFDTLYARSVNLQEIQKRATILSLHIPLTGETRGMVDAAFLGKFEHPLYVLNGSRGEIVHIPSLLEGLDKGRIWGAALDVLPVERFPELLGTEWFEALSQHPRVLLSPHVAGWTTESYYEIANVLSDKVLSFLD